MTGREFEDELFTPQNLSEKPVLEAKGLGLTGFFEGISFTLRKGEILGITGLLDSGRTELALSLFGMRPADKGALYKDGEEIHLKSPQDAIKNRIGLCAGGSLERRPVLAAFNRGQCGHLRN